MNKAITDGIQLMPPAFEFGLGVWSNQDGIPGSTTYSGDPNATLIAADADFSGCLELLKTSATQKLRYTGETPLLPGFYWRIKARVKAISGPLPSVRIGAWAGQPGGGHVAGLTETGSSVALTTYGEVVEVSAIVGSGGRNGVDMVWGQTATFGHFGIDLTGADGGVVRIDDIEIEDVTSIYYRTLIDVVDVLDYGAVGDGVTDDLAAFEAADAAANGRVVLVPDGVYLLGGTLTMNSEIRFQGTVTMPDAALFQLLQNFDFSTYFTAFGDEQLAFEKAVQALFNFTDHDSLDLCGRTVQLTKPVDVHRVVGNKDSYSTRRVIRNGRIEAVQSSNWDDLVATATATYNPSSSKTLSNVSNINMIAVGSLVTGTGVGREVYVRAINGANNTITLSRPLWGAPSSQQYSFTRFQYLLDFSGFTSLSRFVLDELDFACAGFCSGVMLADNGLIFQVCDSFFTAPKDRGLTSIGLACSGMSLDRNQWLSNEQALPVQDRTTVGFNANGNDVKIRDNRAVRFKTWAVLSGTGSIISTNHFFQGDTVGGGTRTAGMVIATNHPKTTFVGNYVDNCFIDWTNEHDATPDIVTGFSFGGLTITGNIFVASDVASWFKWIELKPYGTGHFINGLNISGNVFKSISGPALDRVETVDTSIASLNPTKFRNITIEGNTFTNVTNPFMNPVPITATSSSESASWRTDASSYLPFQSHARRATAIVPDGPITSVSNVKIYTQPYFSGSKGVGLSEFDIKWSQSVKGTVRCMLRCDGFA